MKLSYDPVKDLAPITMGVAFPNALVADLAPLGLVGTAFGWFNLIAGVMILPSSIIFGWLYESYGTRYAFLYSAGCASVALGIFLITVFPFRPDVINGDESQKGLNSIT
jgi:MFS family permease